MVKSVVEEVKSAQKAEKKEFDFVLREFYELKNIFTLIENAEDAKKEGETEHLPAILRELLRRIRREERIDRRMDRAYKRMNKAVKAVENRLASSYPKEVKKIKELMIKAKAFHADLVRLGSRGGEIEKALEEAKTDPEKIDFASNLVTTSLTDVKAFEVIIDELMHVNLFLLKQGDKLDDTDITAELKKMVAGDQAIRDVGVLQGVYAELIGNTDIYNTDRLKKILVHHKITTAKDLHLAWVVLDHADHDPAFQQKALDELPWDKLGLAKDKAVLQDRVLVNTRRPQIYASQGRPYGKFYAFLPIKGAKIKQELGRGSYRYGELINESIREIDERRTKVGLRTLQDYYSLVSSASKRTYQIKKVLTFGLYRKRKISMWLDFSILK